jgi:hypothetical protein
LLSSGQITVIGEDEHDIENSSELVSGGVRGTHSATSGGRRNRDGSLACNTIEIESTRDVSGEPTGELSMLLSGVTKTFETFSPCAVPACSTFVTSYQARLFSGIAEVGRL